MELKCPFALLETTQTPLPVYILTHITKFGLLRTNSFSYLFLTEFCKNSRLIWCILKESLKNYLTSAASLITREKEMMKVFFNYFTFHCTILNSIFLCAYYALYSIDLFSLTGYFYNLCPMLIIIRVELK